MRLLFCLPTTALSGGVKVIFQLVNQLHERGESVDIFSFAGSPKWFPLQARLLSAKNLADIDMDQYDFVLVSNAFMLPMVLPLMGNAKCILFAQDYESFHHANGRSYDDFVSDTPAFSELYRLPVPIIATSRAVQSLLRERVDRDSWYLQLAINKEIFATQKQKLPTESKRVLMVGNYLMPYKGMTDGFKALNKLSTELAVQLVLVTQETRGRAVFDDLHFPVEIHFCPAEEQMPQIISSCDVYCCTSWYEGLGLPALEAFLCGVPVVSTRTYGVSDYGVDEVNLLLANPNDPDDLCAQLKRLLSDSNLSEALRQAAFASIEKEYDLQTTVETFLEILDEIDRSYRTAPCVDVGEMKRLLNNLERTGNLTPIDVYRRFQQLALTLDNVTGRLLNQEFHGENPWHELESIRDELRTYTKNEAAEYYPAFKAKYDWCQVILSLKANSRFAEYLNLMLTRRQEREPRTAYSFHEIQYPESYAGVQGMD